MTNLTNLWVRVAVCSTCVIATAEATAQAKPAGAAAAASGQTADPAVTRPTDSESSIAKTTQSPPTKEACISSHRQAQQAQNDGNLVRARELARVCTALSCPGLVVGDCARWLNELDQRIPSAVFEVRLDGQPNLAASITADGIPVKEWTRGESLRLDPGEHQFRFELPPLQPIIHSVFLAEGMRYRIVSAEFKTPSTATPAAPPEKPMPIEPAAPPAAPPPAPPRRERPTPVIVYPLLGLGAVGAIGFTIFGVMGNSKQSNLESSCKPNCQDSDLKPMKTSYLVGDISLGVGAASLVAAGVLYFTRPEKPSAATVGLSPLPGGAAAQATYRF